MKKVIGLSCATIILSSCGGNSCTGVAQPVNPSYSSLYGEWVNNNNSTIAQINYGLAIEEDHLVPISQAYAASDLAIAIYGDLSSSEQTEQETNLNSMLPNISISIFNSAHACTQKIPHIDSHIESIEVSIDSTDTSTLQQNEDVTSLFSVSASGKSTMPELDLVAWNSVTQYKYRNIWLKNEKASSLMLVFLEPETIEAGSYSFSITAHLEDGSSFEFTTDAVTIE